MAASFPTSPASTTSWSFETIFKFDFSQISERISSIASRCFECLKSLWDRAATAVSSFFTRAPVVSPFSVDENSSAGGANGVQDAVYSVRRRLESESGSESGEPHAADAVGGSDLAERETSRAADTV